MSKDINSEPFDETTLTKLDIFERYLEAWLPVFIQTPSVKSAAIWDFFAGSGQDVNSEPGSPLRILRQINSYSARIVEQDMSIRVVLNESMKRKATALSTLIEDMRASWTTGGRVSVECHNEDFQSLFTRMVPELRRQPNLVFLDQYGVKQVNEDVFKQIIDIPMTDFLFFISSSTIKRFVTTPEISSFFPGLSAETVDGVKMADAHRMVLDYYRQMIPSGNPTRVYPFTLRKGSNVYGLIFGSRHPLGAEKFLDLAWDKNRLNGQANFDIDNDRAKAQRGLFPEYQQLTKRQCFERDLADFIRTAGECTNRQIYEFTLEKGHPKGHAKECLTALRRDKKVDYAGNIGISYRSCIGSKAKIVTVKATDNG